MSDKSRNTDPEFHSVDHTAESGDAASPSKSGFSPASRNQGGNFPPVDSADNVDLGEDSVIPTYTGRATPQNIQPGAATPTQTTAFQRPTGTGANPVSSNGRLASDAPTTVTPPPVQPTRQLDREPQSSDYGDTDFAAAAVPASPVVVPEQPVYMEPLSGAIEDARRGTLDFGLLIIRVTIGLYLTIRGVFTFFTLGGSGGLAGLESEYTGYQWPEILAILLPSLELAAGVFLLLGLMTPVAAAVATVATSFTALHQINVHEGSWGELGEPIVLAVILTLVVIGLQFTGPGRISLDAGRSWARRPLLSSWIFVVIGIVLAVVLWWFGAAVNPVA